MRKQRESNALIKTARRAQARRQHRLLDCTPLRSARCPTVGSRRPGARAWLLNRALGSWLEHRSKQPSPNRLRPSRPSASGHLDLRSKGSGGTPRTIFLRVAASSNPSIERASNVRGHMRSRFLLAFVLSFPAQVFAADFSGVWTKDLRTKAEIQRKAECGTALFDLKQNGDQITGSHSFATVG